MLPEVAAPLCQFLQMFDFKENKNRVAQALLKNPNLYAGQVSANFKDRHRCKNKNGKPKPAVV